MNAATQRWCAWSGPALMVCFLVGLVPLAGFVPPPPPTLTAEQVARLYIDNQFGIRLGMMLVCLGCAFIVPFVAVITVQMRRIEGHHSPLAYTQLAIGSLQLVAFILPAMVWEVAAYRPQDRPATETQLLHDLGWLPFVSFVCFAILQNVTIAVVIFRNDTEEPVFPRWFAYFNIWTAIFYLGGALDVFFKTGPFAWNGVIAFYIPLVVFTAWFVTMTVLLLKAIGVQERQRTSEPEPHGVAAPA